jgi:hypothetical protein
MSVQKITLGAYRHLAIVNKADLTLDLSLNSDHALSRLAISRQAAGRVRKQVSDDEARAANDVLDQIV